jgi:hypothetical protein
MAIATRVAISPLNHYAFSRAKTGTIYVSLPKATCSLRRSGPSCQPVQLGLQQAVPAAGVRRTRGSARFALGSRPTATPHRCPAALSSAPIPLSQTSCYRRLPRRAQPFTFQIVEARGTRSQGSDAIGRDCVLRSLAQLIPVKGVLRQQRQNCSSDITTARSADVGFLRNDCHRNDCHCAG